MPKTGNNQLALSHWTLKGKLCYYTNHPSKGTLPKKKVGGQTIHPPLSSYQQDELQMTYPASSQHNP
jgi:hypothetical protein